ncbi:hypothetical protein [Pseudomonas sp. LT1P18]|uniref:hypothetical protein n=1 Tax=Pseudomonas arabinosi TaxID=3398357 RepID=UPI0039F038DA
MPPTPPSNKLLLPSRDEWSKADNETKRAYVSYMLTVIGTIITVVGLYFGLYPFFTSHQPAPQSYDLSQHRRGEFLDLLSVPQGAHLDTLRIGCVNWSEVSCVAAGRFMILLSEAGWKFDGAQVHRMEPTIPVEGVSIVSRSRELANLPDLPPHMGRWAAIGKSAAIIDMAFRFMDNGVHYSRDPSLPDNMLGIYFGPDIVTTPLFSTEQKSTRRPLITLLKSGLLVESYCSRWNIWFCASFQYFWESSASGYLLSTFSGAARDEWLTASNFGAGYTSTKMEKQQNFLITTSLGVAGFQQSRANP